MITSTKYLTIAVGLQLILQQEKSLVRKEKQVPRRKDHPLFLIQRRRDGSVDFNRTWAEYERGFGSIDGEFWLGNRNIYELTTLQRRKLRIEFETYDGKNVYQEYNRFKLSTPSTDYRLTQYLNFTYTSNDLFSVNAFEYQVKEFTTADKTGSSSCGLAFASGWWFNSCHKGNLNGLYCKTPLYNCGSSHMSWKWKDALTQYFVSLKSSIMGVM